MRRASWFWLGVAAVSQIACTARIEGAASSGPPDSLAGTGSAAATPGASGAPGASAADRPACTPIPARVWRLTPEQIRATWSAALGAAELDARLVPTLRPLAPKAGVFTNSAGVLSMTAGFVESVFGFARGASQSALAGGTLSCVATSPDRACAEAVVDEVGGRAFRRPVSVAEKEALLAFYDRLTTGADGRTRLELLLRRILASPNTLFRQELGVPRSGSEQLELSSPELASALSFLISDAPPDAELSQVTAADELKEVATLSAQAERLLGSAETGAGLWRFFHDYLRVLHPSHPDQEEEARRFVEAVLWSDDATFRSLLLAPYTFVTPALGELYWGSAGTADGWRRVTPPDARVGALTLGGVLSSATNRSARGKFIREYLLCSPPINVPVNVPKVDDSAAEFTEQQGRAPTRAELLAFHTSKPSCAACHSLIDPLGQPFEAFGLDGSARSTDADGAPVVTASVVQGTADMDGPVANATELAAKLAGSAQAQRCFVQHFYSYAYGFEAGEADACFIDELAARFQASGGNIRQLVVDLATAESFRSRARLTQ